MCVRVCLDWVKKTDPHAEVCVFSACVTGRGWDRMVAVPVLMCVKRGTSGLVRRKERGS